MTQPPPPPGGNESFGSEWIAPGGWVPPPPPVPASGGAPGGAPPYPPYGGYPPQAPRPGIIPLRPLGVGEILDGAFAVIRRYPRVTLGLSAIVAAISAGLQLITQLGLSSYPSLSGNSNVTDSLNTGVSSLDVAGIVARILGFILDAILTGMITLVVSDAVLGRQPSARAVWERVRPRFLSLVGVSFLAGLLPVLGLIACIVPGVYLWAALSLTVPAFVLESQGVWASLRRSRELVRGSWWRIFGIRLLGVLLVGIVSSILVIPFVVIGLAVSGVFSGHTPTGTPVLFLLMAALGTLVAQTITAPLQASILALLYVDRRIRVEALDVTLAAAAAAP